MLNHGLEWDTFRQWFSAGYKLDHALFGKNVGLSHKCFDINVHKHVLYLGSYSLFLGFYAVAQPGSDLGEGPTIEHFTKAEENA